MAWQYKHGFLGLVAVFALLVAAPGSTASPGIVAPPEHRRGADQTFLTFPEWYLVYSPAEYAAYIAADRPSTFPWFAHIGQFWQSYDAIYRRIQDEFEFNGEYHVMIMVIGVSTTVEYGIKGAYELTIGRLFESSRGDGKLTEEDLLAARVAQDYVDFIYERPWYEFDFQAALKALWFETSLFGPDMLRKWERKYALTTEYAVKAAYAWLIALGTSASFEAPIHQTAVLLSGPSQELLFLPRYQPFSEAALKQSLAGANFEEIAGNRGRIVLSLWAAADWDPASIGAQQLFTQPIISEPGQTRHVVEVNVAGLGAALRSIAADKLKLEHIYDY
jgi:hypothetical protein